MRRHREYAQIMTDKTEDTATEMRDARYVMHQLTDARANLQSGSLIIDRGEGIHVYDLAGNRYIEAMAGLWSVGLGFSEPRLIEAAMRQMTRLPYYHTRGTAPWSIWRKCWSRWRLCR